MGSEFPYSVEMFDDHLKYLAEANKRDPFKNEEPIWTEHAGVRTGRLRILNGIDMMNRWDKTE